MKTNPFMRRALLAGLALAAAPALAAPVAPHPPLSKLGREMVAAQPGKKVHQCPDAAVVTMPVYPGSLCITNVTVSGNGKKAPIETLVLVSNDSSAKVRAWYGKRLKGWKYDPQIHNFAPPEWSLRKMFSVPQVEIKTAAKQSLSLYGAIYDLSAMHTLIKVYYRPKKGAGK